MDGLITEGNEFEMAYSSQKILNRFFKFVSCNSFFKTIFKF